MALPYFHHIRRWQVIMFVLKKIDWPRVRIRVRVQEHAFKIPISLPLTLPKRKKIGHIVLKNADWLQARVQEHDAFNTFFKPRTRPLCPLGRDNWPYLCQNR